MEGAEDVSRVLGDLGNSLPAADFEIGNSDEDSDASEGSLQTFSRSQHLEEAGLDSSDRLLRDLYSAATRGELSDGGMPPLAWQEGRAPFPDGFSDESGDSQTQPVTSERKDVLTEIRREVVIEEFQVDAASEEARWQQFKSEFTDILQSSEHHMEEEEVQLSSQEQDTRAMRQQLLIDAITAMHSVVREPVESKQNQELPESLSTEYCSEVSRVGYVKPAGMGDLPSSTNAQSHRQRDILSLGRLETIRESDLDRLLEQVESEAPARATRGSFPFPDSNGQEGAPPTVPIVHTSADSNALLMKELEQLNQKQLKLTVSVGTSTFSDTTTVHPAPTSPSHRASETPGHQAPTSPAHHAPDTPSERPTVFLDLRPQKHVGDQQLQPSISGISSSAQRLLALRSRLEGSSSESEDNDDPYAWIAQRQQLKAIAQSHNLKESHKPVSPPSTSHPQPSSSHLQPSSSYPQPSSWRELVSGGWQTGTLLNASLQGIAGSSDKTRQLKAQCSAIPGETSSTIACQQVGVTTQDSKSSSDAAPTSKVSSSSNVSEKVNVTKVVETTTTHRQRSNDSLTLSSSLSESEALSSDAVQQNELTSSKQAATDLNPPPSPTKGKKASTKKHAKKSKKAKQKGVSSQETKAGSSEDRGKKKQPRRQRNDSYTTSSDEEPVRREALVQTVLQPEERGPAVEIQEGGSAVVDTEKLKLLLQRKIQSKKPPSHFVTPATDCILHEDISFEPLITSIDPTMRTDALLVLPLSEQGLTLLPEAFSELDMTAQQIFHSLVLTWLIAVIARNAHIVKSGSSQSDCGKEQPPGTSIPFRITAMQQTIFDGNPAVVMGVVLLSDCATNPSTSNSECVPLLNANPPLEHFQFTPTVQTLNHFIHNTTFATPFEQMLEDSTIQKWISATVQTSLEPLLHLPLSGVFSLHSDHSTLTMPVSFYWYSRYTPCCLPSNQSLKSHTKLQTTVTTICQQSLAMGGLIFSIFHSILLSGLDIAGLRLAFGEAGSSIDMSSGDSMPHKLTLAVAIRGPDATCRWLEIVGPEDSTLAKVTDPQSLSALFGFPGKEIIHCVHTPYRASAALAKWFGGRGCLKTGSVLGVSDARTKSERRKRQRVRFSESESEDSLPSPLPDVAFPPLISNRALLIAPCYSKIFVVVSPHIPPSCYSTVLASCSQLGFDIFGVKRIRLNSKRAVALNISPCFIAHFTPSSTPPSPATVDFVVHPLLAEHTQYAPPSPSLLLIIGRENAAVHSVALRNAIFADLSSLLEESKLDVPVSLKTPDTIVHTTEFAEEVLKVVGDFSSTSTIGSSQPQLAEGRDTGGPLQEDLCFIAVTHGNSLPKTVQVLSSVFHVQPIHDLGNPALLASKSNDSSCPNNDEREELGGFELLGLKFLPQLSRFHAKHLCPFSPEDPLYQPSVQSLSDTPVILLVFRGISCNRRLRNILPQTSKSILHTSTSSEPKLQVIISPGLREAFSLTSMFFTDKELFSDPENWALASYVPPAWLHDCTILQSLQSAPKLLYSVLTVVSSQIKLLVKILEKLSRSDFNFVGLALHFSDKETVIEDLQSASQVEECRFVVCLQRVNAVWYLEKQLRPFILSSSTYKQAITYSQSFSSAVKDMKHYFTRGLCCQPTTITKEHDIPCPVSDDVGGMATVGNQFSSDGSSSPLLETTCVVVPPIFFQHHDERQPSFISALELVSQAGFEIRGLRMVLFSEQRARALCCCFSEDYKVDKLCGGPSLVMVLRRDNAASCFQLVLKSTVQSSYRGNADQVDKLLADMFVPRNAKEAKQVLQLLEVEE